MRLGIFHLSFPGEVEDTGLHTHKCRPYTMQFRGEIMIDGTPRGRKDLPHLGNGQANIKVSDDGSHH